MSPECHVGLLYCGRKQADKKWHAAYRKERIIRPLPVRLLITERHGHYYGNIEM